MRIGSKHGPANLRNEVIPKLNIRRLHDVGRWRDILNLGHNRPLSLEKLSGDSEFFREDRPLPVPYACARYCLTLHQLVQFFCNKEHTPDDIAKAAHSKLFIGWCFLVVDAVHDWMLPKPTDAKPATLEIPRPPSAFSRMLDFPGNDITVWKQIKWDDTQSIIDGLFPGRRAPMRLIDIAGSPTGLPERDTDALLHWEVLSRKE